MAMILMNDINESSTTKNAGQIYPEQIKQGLGF